MKLEDQVVSLELAKKMKDLGFEQESLFVWCPSNRDASEWVLRDWNEPIPVPREAKDVLPAYTVAELGEMLPDIKNDGELYISKFDKSGERVSYEATYRSIGNKNKIVIQGRKKNLIPTQTMAGAMAKMLIHLKEHNLI